MRAIIYSETPAALRLRDQLRAAGGRAVLANPQYFDPADFDRDCSAAYADDPAVREAYEAAGISAHPVSGEPKPEAPGKPRKR